MKVAVVTDSNSGITQSKAKEIGISVIPMPFMINGETFEEDINLTQEQFYEKMVEGAEISTSQPSPEIVMNLWSELLQSYDEIVHIPMSSALSSSCQTAMMLAEDFEGRVFVVDNQRISVTQYQSTLDALKLAQAGLTGAQIKEILEREARESSIYIMVDTLKYLKKGGRITPAAATIGTVLNLKPVLQLQGEKLDAFAKVRGKKQARRTMLKAMKADFEGRFAPFVQNGEMCLQAAYTGNPEEAEEWKQEMQETFPGMEIHMDPLSLSVACHIGYGSLAIACSKKVTA